MSTKRRKRTPSQTSPLPHGAEHAPRWTPSPHPEVDLLYLVKFLQRHTLELDDGGLAPESAASFSSCGPAVALSWVFLKALWRAEEAALGARCTLCDEALLVYRFRRGGHRSPGLLGAARRCAACAVLYEGLGDAAELDRSLLRVSALMGRTRAGLEREGEARRELAAPSGIASPAEVSDGLMRVGELSGSRAAETKVKPHDAPRWTRRLPQCPGTYVVATLDGRARTTRQVSRDPRTLSFRDEAPEPWDGWWWGRPVV